MDIIFDETKYNYVIRRKNNSLIGYLFIFERIKT